MKIQVISTSAYPKGNVTTKRVHFLCKGLVENGLNVNLLITNPTEVNWIERNSQPYGSFENVDFSYIGNQVIRKKNKIIRKIIDFYCHLLVLKQILLNKKNFDLFLIIGTSLDFRFFIPLLVKFNRKKIILEINEYLFVSKKNNLLTKIKRIIITFFHFPLFDGFIVISTKLKDFIQKYKSKKSEIIIIPIIGDFPPDNKKQNGFQEKYITHIGSLSDSKDGILGILSAIKKSLSEIDENILKLYITGNHHSEKDKKIVLNHIEKLGLDDSVSFLGHLNNEELNKLILNSSFVIINKPYNQQNIYCFPTKIIDYIYNRVPMIISSVGDVNRYFIDGENALIIDPDNQELLVNAINRLIQDPVLGKKLSTNALMLLEKDLNYLYNSSLLKIFFEKSNI
ncbi:MAG TPA: hypothetical protein DCW42_03065 [Bacteroidetes bacterium]|jgi:glycosyltransferase involved in cell wall biosynthesis|nr:hypothetical protein [Bacteroidota bacterium]